MSSPRGRIYDCICPEACWSIREPLTAWAGPYMSLSCGDALHPILEIDVRWYAVGQGTLRAPDTRATPPSSRHDRSGPRPSLGLRVATDAAIQLHGSAPALVTVLASSCAVTRNGH